MGTKWQEVVDYIFEKAKRKAERPDSNES